MLRKNLLLLYGKIENTNLDFISDYIYGSFEPECILNTLKELIINGKKSSPWMNISSMKNLTKFGLSSRIKFNRIYKFEFNPICIKDSNINGIVNHLYAINTTDEYKSFKINIDKSINSSIANRKEKNSGFLIFDLPKEVVIPPNNMLVVSASHDKSIRILDYNITERIDLNA